MRRALPFVLLVAILAALGVSAAVSSGDNAEKPKRASTATPVAAPQSVLARHGSGRSLRGHGGMVRMVADQVLASGARRLGVEKRALRTAAKATIEAAVQRRMDAVGLTPAQQANLRACKRAFHRARRSASCDRGEARAALRKLHAGGLPDLAKEKGLVASDLASRLGKSEEDVLTAGRAELEQRLGQAVSWGFLSDKGRELALGCFDAPAACDLDALHDEVRMKLGKHLRRHG